jgi:hypothetical protein
MFTIWYSSSGTLKEACQKSDPHKITTISASGSLTLDSACDLTYNCTLEKPAAFPFDHKRCRLLLFIEQDDNALVEMRWNREDSTLGGNFHKAWRVSR